MSVQIGSCQVETIDWSPDALTGGWRLRLTCACSVARDDDRLSDAHVRRGGRAARCGARVCDRPLRSARRSVAGRRHRRSASTKKMRSRRRDCSTAAAASDRRHARGRRSADGDRGRVARRLGLPGHPPEAAAAARDKRLDARAPRAAGPAGAVVHRSCRSRRDADARSLERLSFPVVVKPTRCRQPRRDARRRRRGLRRAFERLRRLLRRPDVRASATTAQRPHPGRGVHRRARVRARGRAGPRRAARRSRSSTSPIRSTVRSSRRRFT